MTVAAMTRLRLRRIVALAILLITPTLQAQDGGPEYVDLRFVTVASDQQTEWAPLLRKRRDVVQEQGMAFFHVFQRLRGPLGVYLIVTPHTPVGTPASERANTYWLEDLQKTVASQSLITAINYTGPPTNSWSHPAEPFMLARRFTAAADQSNSYGQWLAGELAPAYRDAGVDDARTLRAVVGWGPGTWIHLTFMDSWPGKRLGLDQSMLNRGAAMVVGEEYYLYSFREDLSYTAD